MININNARNELNERGSMGWDLETTGVKTYANKPGGPVQTEYIRPLAAAFVSENEFGFETLMDLKAGIAPHILPSPVALAVNGIDPNDLLDPNMPSQLEMVQALSDLLQDDVPILFSYNGIQFDAVVLRHSLFENFGNPYLLSDRNRVHIDLLKVAESIFATNPDALNFPWKNNGNIELRQKNLAQANGIDTGQAHTAIDDTKVVLELGALFREVDPEVYFSAIASGNKHRVIHHLNNESVICHAYVERFTRQPKVRALSMIGQNPIDAMSKKFLTFDLSYDPEDYLKLSIEEIVGIMNKKNSPFFELKVSDNPILLPAHYTEKIQLSEQNAQHRASRISERFKEKVGQAMKVKGNPFADWPIAPYSESKLYAEGWPKDTHLYERFLTSDNKTRKEMLPNFIDPRVLDFAKRIIAIDQGPQEPEIYEEYMTMCRSRFFAKSETVPYLTYDGAIAQIDQIIEMGYSEEVVNPIGNYFEDMREKLS